MNDTLNLAEEPVKYEKLTPAKVLSWLPSDATPAQQDSAIQAHFKPGEIHWSERPDTLGLPSDGPFVETDFTKGLQFLRESYFSRDSLYNPEVRIVSYGVEGDPIPYTIAGDNLITSLLLGCFILAMLAFSHSRQFIIRQGKSFFRALNEKTSAITETTSELRFQFFLVAQTCLLFAIIYFFYREAEDVTKVFLLEQYQLIGVYVGMIAAYFLVKAILYCLVDWVFFSTRLNEVWLKSYLFLISAEGVLLFPVVILQSYFQTSGQFTFAFAVGVVVLAKLLSLYRCYVIFFRQKGGLLQIILYFCALEMTTLILFWTFIEQISDYLTINY